ncbi:MAG TPA: hypothetical protein PKZ12_05350 [Smithellaceae bacterium]|nr:hypothetical protein [Smithellaceae bacterium]
MSIKKLTDSFCRGCRIWLEFLSNGWNNSPLAANYRTGKIILSTKKGLMP